MAKLRVIQSIESENYIFVFSVDLDSINDDEYSRIKRFGAPAINFGGSFTNGSDITYTLPDLYYDLPAQFPVTRTFSLVAPFDTNADNKFALYRTTMITRITTAFTTLRAIGDTFTGEFINNI